jgi:molybdopterin-binding protein
LVSGEDFQFGAAKRYECGVCGRVLDVEPESNYSSDVVTQQAVHQLKLAIQKEPMALVNTQ